MESPRALRLGAPAGARGRGTGDIMPGVRHILALLAFLAGCTTHSKYRADELTLGPWRTIMVGSRVCAIASDMSDREHVLVASEDSIALIRLRDGAIERKKAIALHYEPMAMVPFLWSGDRIFIGAGSKLIILKNWEFEEERPIPQSYEAGFFENRRTGRLYMTTPDGLFSFDLDSRSWKLVLTQYQVLHSQLPSSVDGSIVTSGGILRDDGTFRPFGHESLRVSGLWRSSDDPRFILAAAYPAPAVSRDGGNAWELSKAYIPGGHRHCAGFDTGRGRLLFVESHSGKMGLGALWGPSQLWASRDDGRTFELETMPDRPCGGMVVVGQTLVMRLQGGELVAADIIPRGPR